LGREEEIQALKRLDDQAGQLERIATGPSFEEFVTKEGAQSTSLCGRSVLFGKRISSGDAGLLPPRTNCPAAEYNDFTD
jgi:uncharacterized protein